MATKSRDKSKAKDKPTVPGFIEGLGKVEVFPDSPKKERAPRVKKSLSERVSAALAPQRNELARLIHKRDSAKSDWEKYSKAATDLQVDMEQAERALGHLAHKPEPEAEGEDSNLDEPFAQEQAAE